MKYAVDILTKAAGALEDDNLKGERRWERQAARALLDAGREVGAPRDSWDRPDTSRWLGTVGDLSGHALVTQADPGTVRYRPGAEAFITNIFSGMIDSGEAEIRRAVQEMGRERVALTHGFQVHVPPKRLPPDLHDLIHWLPVPAVPRVHFDHEPFANKTLLWAARAISFRMINPIPSILSLLDWIRETLRADPGLIFEVMACEERMSQEEADRYVWGFRAFEEAFRDMKSQIRIHPSIGWSDVQTIFARTKLMVNDPTAFGGPPIEAASFGIPVAGTACSLFHMLDPREVAGRPLPPITKGLRVGGGQWWDHRRECPEDLTPVPGFPELVIIDGDKTRLVDQLECWHRDERAYQEAGNACRKFVHDTYTYDSFVRHLDALPVFS